MAKQLFTFSLNPGGEIINAKPSALYPAMSYPADGRGGIVSSGNNFTVYIKKPGQGVPVHFKMQSIEIVPETIFTLTWGADPRDLDSHLLTPVIEGSSYHVYYGQKGSSDSPPYALLYEDDTTSYGPEIIHIYKPFNGVYHFYIYWFRGSAPFPGIDAQVEVRGNIILPPEQSSALRYWDICTLTYSDAVPGGSLAIINQLTATPPT